MDKVAPIKIKGTSLTKCRAAEHVGSHVARYKVVGRDSPRPANLDYMRSRCTPAIAGTTLALACAALVACGGKGDSEYSNDPSFIQHLKEHHIATGATVNADPDFGRAICAKIDSGSTAEAEINAVADRIDKEFSPEQAQVIVYWAVNDLCPRHGDQLKLQWKDAT